MRIQFPYMRRAPVLGGILVALLLILVVEWRSFSETPTHQARSEPIQAQDAANQVVKTARVQLVQAPLQDSGAKNRKKQERPTPKKAKPAPKKTTVPVLSKTAEVPLLETAPEPVPSVVEQVDPVELGSQMTAGGARLGEFPTVVAEYRGTIGFGSYRAALSRLGARFFILDEGSRQLIGQINFLSGKIYAANSASTRGLSSRSRALDDEPGLTSIMASAKHYCAAGACSPIVLYPVELDMFVIGSIQLSLQKKSRDIQEFSQFIGKYHLVRGELVLAMEYAIDQQGTKIRFPLNLNMTRKTISQV